MGYASSMAVALFAVVMGVSLILIKMRRTAAW
jgi:ABC-type sugar transport system permease subunit